jgi:negative regulator of sigma E activity
MVNAGDDALNEALSAVMDGRATPADWACVNAAWRRDPGLRERWALWHAAGDGLRSAELPNLHREPEVLLAALHAQMPAAAAEPPRRRRDWFAPIAVAAGFVAVTLGVSVMRPAPVPSSVVAVAPIAAPHTQGLAGASFAQTAAGRTLPVLGSVDAPPEIDWGLASPESPASQPALEAPRR